MGIRLIEKEQLGVIVPNFIYNPALIQLKDIIKIFKTSAGEFPALKKVNTSIIKGQYVSIVGKSGSGKSTLMNMLTGIDYPTSGDVLIADTNIRKMSESQRALWRGKNLGIVFQFFQLLPMLTLLENVMLPMDYCNVFLPQEREKRAKELLDRVGLAGQVYKLPAALSSGQQQAAAVARALATDPPIIIADEPTGNLDSRSAEMILSTFDNFVQQGKTILIVTHDASITKRTNRTIIISDGELVDETIAAALPMLSHENMLKATKFLRRIFFQPGAMIMRQGEHNDLFFMITRGEIEIVLKPRMRRELIVTRMGSGQFFGEIELVHGGKNIASIRAAADTPVELVALHREDFNSLLNESQLTQDYINQVMEVRVNENSTLSRKRRRK